jgi:DnaJ-class molecular chaperone
MDKKDYYEILEIDKNATQEDIKKSYRKLSLLHHPDKNGNSQESINKIQDINEAYEVLSNQEKKMMYDNQQNGMMFPPGMDDIPVDIHNLFSTIFHGNNMFHPGGEMNTFRVFFNGHGNHVIHPPSIVKTIVIPFERVLSNLKIPIEINRFVQEQNRRMQENETIYIDIPQGIDDGEIILIKEKGNIIDNFKGNIKILIKIENNTEFKRVGLDLIYEKTISLKEALCGFIFELKHLNGKTYTITNSSTVGHVICQNYQKVIPNMGLMREEHLGNLIIVFNVKFPEQLSESVLEELKKINF